MLKITAKPASIHNVMPSGRKTGVLKSPVSTPSKHDGDLSPGSLSPSYRKKEMSVHTVFFKNYQQARIKQHERLSQSNKYSSYIMVPIELNPEPTINNQFPMRLPSELMTRHPYLRRYHPSRKQLSFEEGAENQEQNLRNTFHHNSRPLSSWKQNAAGEQSPKKQSGKGASFLIKKMTAHATPKKSTSMRVGKYENIAYSTFLITSTSPSNHNLKQGN